MDLQKVELSILNQTQKDTECLLKIMNLTYLHIDIMDGYFVKNTSSITPFFLKNLDINKYKLHLHFMVEDAFLYFQYYCFLENIDSVSFHVENDFFQTGKYKELIKVLQEKNIKIGLVLNPATSIKILEGVDMKNIDFIMLMSVIPGKGGQVFIEKTALKIKELSEKYDVHILLDGGVNETIYKKYKDKVERFIIGSYLYNI